MKKLTTFILLVLLSVLGGCKDDDPKTGPGVPGDEGTTLAVTPAALNFVAEGEAQTLAITTDGGWRINYSTTSWCKPQTFSGSGNATVTITAEKNEAEESRAETMTVVAGSADPVTITLTQAGKTPDPVLPDYIEPDQTGMRDLGAVEFSRLMKIGWNLGNSMESILVNEGVYTGNETSWGNPRVTKELIDAVKAAGFNAVRIPVAWSHSLEADGLTIKSEWMKRVKEVVDYAIANDMFVLINIHWDGGWMDHPDNTHKEEINTKLAALWKQIAKNFRDYDDRLLFAGTNEVHMDGDYSNMPEQEYTDVQNSFNQTFVTTVRATGGRNTYRQLVVQAYNTNIAIACDRLVMPDDPTPNRLMAEVHFYDPYDFALKEDEPYKTQWGQGYTDVSDWGQEAWVDETFGKMKTNFVDRGIGVILGEYGAVLRTSLPEDKLAGHVDSRDYYLHYVTRAAKQNGLVPFYWDNGNAGDKGFALFNRNTAEVAYPETVQKLMTATE